VSGELAGEPVDVGAVTEGDARNSGVEAGELLVAFAEAATRDSAELPTARAALREALGPEALVDAAAVVGNFERMVRIADASGIPLDAPMAAASADLQRALGIDRYASAANTPTPGPLARAVGSVARRLAFAALRLRRRRA